LYAVVQMKFFVKKRKQLYLSDTMKRFLVGSAVVLTLSSVGCSNILDIKPQLSVSYEQALNSTQGLNNAINGGYSLFIDGSLVGGNFGIIAELLSDQTNFQGGDAFGYGQIVARQMELVNTVGRSTWENAYNAINRVNLAIDAIRSGQANGDPTFAAQRNRIEGEGLFLRAVLHFEVVRLYAQPFGFTPDNSHPGIPYRTVGTQGVTNARTRRAPVSEVYAQIITDLQSAQRLLPIVGSKGKPSQIIVRAILARIYLQQERYAEAWSEADAVITTNNYSLNPDPRSAFTEKDTKEVVYELTSEVDIQDAAGGYRGNYSAEINGGAAALAASDTFLATLNAATGDKRRAMFRESIGRTYTNRYDVLWSNLPFIRIAEMYLIRAEAGFRTSRPLDQIRSDVNRTRVRAGLSAMTIESLTGEALFQAIQSERALELVFQGHRLHDLRRWRQPIGNGSRPGVAPLTWNDPRLVVPRPDREVSVNPD
jgi:starch-binding outer membrane protein, SusD/RagB family